MQIVFGNLKYKNTYHLKQDLRLQSSPIIKFPKYSILLSTDFTDQLYGAISSITI